MVTLLKIPETPAMLVAFTKGVNTEFVTKDVILKLVIVEIERLLIDARDAKIVLKAALEICAVLITALKVRRDPFTSRLKRGVAVFTPILLYVGAPAI